MLDLFFSLVFLSQSFVSCDISTVTVSSVVQGSSLVEICICTAKEHESYHLHALHYHLILTRPLPKRIVAAVVMTTAWEATSSGHDVDLAVGACLGAHALLRPGEFARISWEWVTSDGNGNPRPSRRCPASGRGVQYDAPSATCTASSPEPPHWRAESLLANFSPSHCPPWSRNGPRETSALCAATYGIRSLTGKGKMESCGISGDATPKVVVSLTR